MKTERTKKLEELLSCKFNRYNDFYVFECTIGWFGGEIVDCIKYSCDRLISCYEIRQSVQDFHSKNKLTFIGNKNYFVMPYSLYEKVENEISNEIGVYVAIEKIEQKQKKSENGTLYYPKITDGLKELYCIKPARKVDLKADKEVILSSMLRSMQRDRVSEFGWERTEVKSLEHKIEEQKREIVRLRELYYETVAKANSKHLEIEPEPRQHFIQYNLRHSDNIKIE